MEFLSAEFFSALLAIIMIDLVLAGDNAIVIGMAARRLPKDMQKKVIMWGTVGAVVVRVLATLVIVALLKIPGLLLIGGVLLVWIAYKLLAEQEDEGEIKESENMWAAVRTIIIADAAMGLDNVLAVGGAAHGNYLLVVLGLVISIPLVVWGSTIILKLMERFPMIIYIGAAVLAWTAARMITEEPFLDHFFDTNPFIHGVFLTSVIAGVVLAGMWKNQRNKDADQPA